MGLDDFLRARANSAPLVAALDALVQVTHALFDVTGQHVVLVDLLAAPANDLVADHRQQALHAAHAVVVLAKLEDDAHVVKHFRQQFGDVSRLRLLNLLTRFLQQSEEHEIIICLFMSFVDFLR